LGKIEHTGNHEVRFRGLKIFLTEDLYDNDEIKIVVQYLLEHGINCYGDAVSIDDAIREIEPLLPENAEFEISHSVGIDVFLLRELGVEEMKPKNLDEILTPLTKFAEFATTKVSITHLAPEFKLKKSLT
jgi:predicted P-loop ATPase/GTPase